MNAAPRILFVDDEQRILEGIENLLFEHTQWDTQFACSGDAALERLRAGPSFDVLVTDMRMPGMDGLDLLQHVLQEQPHMMRIVLSGEAELHRAMRRSRSRISIWRAVPETRTRRHAAAPFGSGRS